jgi:release factor glutamine methyltransferase
VSVPDAGIVIRLRAAGCVFAEDEARLLISAARTPGELEAMVGRRVVGLPLEQVLGWAEFCGLRIAVDPGIFVPRRRTEFLVQQAALLIRGEGVGPGGTTPRDPPDHGGVVHPPVPARPPWAGPGIIIVDLCCGTGAIGAALAAAVGGTEVHAVDIDPAAVRCARRNVPGHVYQGDLYEPLPGRLRGRVGILAANVPYVPSGQISLLPAEARAHEPLVALDGGTDGLDVLRRVAAGAPAWLAPGGYLLIETSERQAAQAAAAFAGSGLQPRVMSSADRGATIVIGRLPASDTGASGSLPGQ